MSTPRDLFAAHAMTVLLLQHPTATRGWIAQMANALADEMVSWPSRNARPHEAVADAPRVYAEDEPNRAGPMRPTVPDSIRYLARFVPGFTP